MHYKTAAGIQKIAGILRGLRKEAEDGTNPIMFRGLDKGLINGIKSAYRKLREPVNGEAVAYSISLDGRGPRATPYIGNIFLDNLSGKRREIAKRTLDNMEILGEYRNRTGKKLPDFNYQKYLEAAEPLYGWVADSKTATPEARKEANQKYYEAKQKRLAKIHGSDKAAEMVRDETTPRSMFKMPERSYLDDVKGLFSRKSVLNPWTWGK